MAPKKSKKAQLDRNAVTKPNFTDDELNIVPSESHRVSRPDNYDTYTFKFDEQTKSIVWSKVNPYGSVFYNQLWWPLLRELQPTKAEVKALRKKLDRLATGILERHQTLKDLVSQSRGDIASAWRTASRRQREDLLVKAWSLIPRNVREDIAMALCQRSGSCSLLGEDSDNEALATESSDSQDDEASEKARAAYLVPQFNVPDLKATTEIMDILGPRTEHLPNVFALEDLEEMRVGLFNDGIDKLAIPGAYQGYTVQMDGDNLGLSQYGKLLNATETLSFYRKDLNVRKGLTTSSSTVDLTRRIPRHLWTPQPALLVLEAHSALYSFLTTLCTTIMIDYPNPAHSRPLPTTVQLSQSSPHRPFEADSLVVKLIVARLNEGTYHLHALRNNPAYFQDQLQCYVKHHAEVIDRNVLLMPAPLAPSATKLQEAQHAQARSAWLHKVKGVVAVKLMVDAYLEQSEWQALYLMINSLSGLYTRFVIAEKKSSQNPDSHVIDAGYKLWLTINHLRKRLVRALAKKIDKTVPLWSTIDHANPRAGKLKEDRWLAQILSNFADSGFADTFGYPKICDFIEAHAQNDLDFTSTWHQHKVRDIAMLAAITKELGTWDARRFCSELQMQRAHRKDPDNKVMNNAFPARLWSGPYISAFSVRENAKSPGVADWESDLPDHSIRFLSQGFAYTQDPVTKKHYQDRIIAEQHLDALWLAFDLRVDAYRPYDTWELDADGQEWMADWKEEHPFTDLKLGNFPGNRTEMPPYLLQEDDSTDSKGKGKMVAPHQNEDRVGPAHSSTTHAPENASTKFDVVFRGKHKEKTRPEPAPQQPGEPLDLQGVDNEEIVDDEEALADDLADFEAGEADIDDDAEEELLAEDEGDEELSLPTADGQLPLNRQDYAAMSKLFGAVQGQVKWIAVRKALGHMNFSVVKLTGSLWELTPPEHLNLKHAITVHTHGAKLPTWIRREIAAHMNRVWEWTADTFLEK